MSLLLKCTDANELSAKQMQDVNNAIKTYKLSCAPVTSFNGRDGIPVSEVGLTEAQKRIRAFMADI